MSKVMTWWQLLSLLLVVAACASAPKMSGERLYFFPNQADIFLQVNIPKFRKLNKALAKELEPAQAKALKQAFNFTGQIALFTDKQDFMLRALGNYPKTLVTNILNKQPSIVATRSDMFRVDLASVPARLDNGQAWEIYFPKSGEIYLSNQLDREIKRMQSQPPITLPLVVRSALLSNRNAVLYTPAFSQLLQFNGIEDPLPVPIEGLLLTIEPKGSRYYVSALALFSDDDTQQRKLVAQARFIVSTFANNRVLRNFEYQLQDDGVLFNFDIRHKDSVLALGSWAQNLRSSQEFK